MKIAACSGSWKNSPVYGFRERQQEILGSWVEEMILRCLSALSWRSLLVSACVINNIIASVQLDSANGADESTVYNIYLKENDFIFILFLVQPSIRVAHDEPFNYMFNSFRWFVHSKKILIPGILSESIVEQCHSQGFLGWILLNTISQTEP